jgi:hypothetical protein
LQPKTSGKNVVLFFFLPLPRDLLPSFSQFYLICSLLLPKVTYSSTSPFFFVLPFLLLSLFLLQKFFYNVVIIEVFFTVVLYFLVYNFK